MAGDRLLLAKIGAPHGVRGEVRLKVFAADPASLGAYGPLADHSGRRFELERVRPGKEVAIAKFRGVDDRNAAEALNGISLTVERDRLPAPDEDEFYHADLIGLAAVDQAGAALGTIVAVHDFGAGDLLEIAPPRGPTTLVPFTKGVVPVVDIAGGRIVVVPPAEAEDEAEPQGETAA
jgi:16S rRNA processing protein RimM